MSNVIVSLPKQYADLLTTNSLAGGIARPAIRIAPNREIEEKKVDFTEDFLVGLLGAAAVAALLGGVLLVKSLCDKKKNKSQ